MKTMLRTVVRLLILPLFVLWAEAALAQAPPPQGVKDADARLAVWEKDAAQVDKALAENSIDDESAQELRALIEPQRTKARALSDAAKQEMKPLQEQIAALGPGPEPGETEEESLARDRAVLQKKIDELKAIASKAELAHTRADRLLADIANAQRARFTERLLTRGPSPLNPENWVVAGQSALSAVSGAATETVTFATDGKRMQVWRESGTIALTALLFAIVLMVVARRTALRWLFSALRGPKPEDVDAGTELAAFGGTATQADQASPVLESGDLSPPQTGYTPSRGRRLLIGIGVTLTRLAIPLVAIFAARHALMALQVFGPTGETILNGLTRAAVILAAAYALAYAFFAPSEPRLRLSLMDNRRAAIAAWLSMLLATTLALDNAIIWVGQELNWPIEALNVFNVGILILGALSLLRLASITAPPDAPAVVIGHEDEPVETAPPEMWLSHRVSLIGRRFAYAVAIATPLLAIAGYFALSRFIFYNVLLSVAVIAALVMIHSVAKEACTALSEATRSRSKDTAESEEERPGLLPVFIGFILVLVAIPALALIWGATTNDLGEAYYALTNGFTVGDTIYRPGDLVIAALVFGAGLFITRAVQAVIRRTVMPRTRLDAGVRSSIVAGLGYLGFFVSALMAVGVAGLDLSSLAFLGAALGVGIGFGLQNIVNNFVSGVILLIERPIKVGDWIEVGGTHGTVEKVNVRSTEIKTFDKASYIVPNSDLISGAVMNMTHGDLLGRVIAPVGVAYGTDARKVEKILLEIARAHPMILRRPPPQVIFKQFGADSLDFELRGFLRDVNWILSTHSDINFEIDRRFREEGIEIPFAQRDLHIKDAKPLLDAMQSSRNEPFGGEPATQDSDATA